MVDLSHWDYAVEFTGQEAAFLIRGKDFSAESAISDSVRPVFERLERAYRLCWEFHLAADEDEIHANNLLIFKTEMLESVKLKAISDEVRDGFISRARYCELLKSDFLRYENQRFTRTELTRWLAENKLESEYVFTLNGPQGRPRSGRRWPWGKHHTEMLGHVEAAAMRFWVNYDPSDISTASTNNEVVKWLQKECKVSETMAEAIASMLRPDGLRTGPR